MGGLEGPPKPPDARQHAREAGALLDPPDARQHAREAGALLDPPTRGSITAPPRCPRNPGEFPNMNLERR
jgi:hypothetical protein